MNNAPMPGERANGRELLVYHAFGNMDVRTRNGRNIKGTGVVRAAVERLQGVTRYREVGRIRVARNIRLVARERHCIREVRVADSQIGGFEQRRESWVQFDQVRIIGAAVC